MFKLHGPYPDESTKWERLYLRRAILADMRHLTQFSIKYGGRTNIFANAAGYLIPPSHTGRLDLPPESKSGFTEVTREIYLLGTFHEGDCHPAAIAATMVFTTFNALQQLPTLTEFTIFPAYKCQATNWAEQIMIITLREFVRRCISSTRKLSWADIGEFVGPFVRFGVQVGEPRIFGALWQELFTCIDGDGPVLNHPSAGECFWQGLSPSSVPVTKFQSTPGIKSPRLAYGTTLSETYFPESSITLSPARWVPSIHTGNTSKHLPTLEPEPTVASLPNLNFKPDFGVGWLACGEARSRRIQTHMARIGSGCIL